MTDGFIPPGTLVERRQYEPAPGEVASEIGRVVHCWESDEFPGFDCYVAFYGEAVPDGKPNQIPYVLRYSSNVLTVLEE